MSKSTEIKTSITRQIVFPKKLIDLAESKYSQLGLNLPEYVRHLIIKDVEDIANLPMVDEETEKAIGRSLADYKAGRYTTLKSAEEIDAFLDNLTNE